MYLMCLFASPFSDRSLSLICSSLTCVGLPRINPQSLVLIPLLLRAGLPRRPPGHLRFDELEVHKETKAEGAGNQGIHPAHNEHDDDTRDGADETEPMVVVLERGAPPRGAGYGAGEGGIVNKAIGDHKKIGYNRGDLCVVCGGVW